MWDSCSVVSELFLIWEMVRGVVRVKPRETVYQRAIKIEQIVKNLEEDLSWQSDLGKAESLHAVLW